MLVMIEGLLLGKALSTTLPSTIITPTPIKYQKPGMSTPSMISAASYSSPPSTVSPTIDWTHDRILNLIQLYEKKSVLWNPSNPEYFHRDIRNMVYDDLVRELNVDNLTVNETKRKLENLRSYFRRETKKLHDHERKTGEKLISRWPYYESLQFIHEFMSVKNEAGAESGFAKKPLLQNMARSATYLPTMNFKSEVPVVEECAVQVPVGSTPVASSETFQLGNQDLVAVLKALQGPLAEQAATCFVNSISVGELSDSCRSPHLSPSTRVSPNTKDVERPSTPAPLLPHNLAIPNMLRVENGAKRRKLERDDDLCADYGRTVAHQLRQMDDYNRDMCRLQIDQLIFNVIHKAHDTQHTSPSHS